MQIFVTLRRSYHRRACRKACAPRQISLEPSFPLLQCISFNILFLSVLFLYQLSFPQAELKVFLKSFCSASSRVVFNGSYHGFSSLRLVTPDWITALARLLWPFLDSSRETMGQREIWTYSNIKTPIFVTSFFQYLSSLAQIPLLDLVFFWP